MRHDRRCFGRLEQEDQRLKKHYGRWMDIVRSLELESFILTKLTKPFVPVNLVGPQVSLPPRWVPAIPGHGKSGPASPARKSPTRPDPMLLPGQARA